MSKGFVAACMAVSMLAACGGGTVRRAAPTPALHNPLRFPLYPGASLVSVRAFRQVVHADSSSGSAFAEGNGTYAGHEVIAATAASFGTLQSWLDRLDASAPAGYVAQENQSNPDQQMQSRRFGLDYAAFTRKSGKNTHGVLVIVMDPQRVNRRFGTILGMIAKYKALPFFLRAPVDHAAQARFGMTITQATQPDSPIGAALSALNELQHRSDRGIVVVDAHKV